jgi:hypothetical protein
MIEIERAQHRGEPRRVMGQNISCPVHHAVNHIANSRQFSI